MHIAPITAAWQVDMEIFHWAAVKNRPPLDSRKIIKCRRFILISSLAESESSRGVLLV
jgi:hypothetical protein